MPRGGRREGAGRPKSALTQLKERAICDGLIWYNSPLITAAMIQVALNGDPSMLKYLGDRMFGRIGDTPPIAMQLKEIENALPEDFDAEALMASLQAELVGEADSGPVTTEDVAAAGRKVFTALCTRAMRGDHEAQSLIARFILGEPVQTWREQVAQMDESQVRAEMVRRYQAAWGLDEETATAMVEAIAAKVDDTDNAAG